MGKMSINIYIKGGYEVFYALKPSKKQSQFGFTAENAVFAELYKIIILSNFTAFPAISAVNLKKQSQFHKTKVSASVYLKRFTEKTACSDRGKTKPNSKPMAGFWMEIRNKTKE